VSKKKISPDDAQLFRQTVGAVQKIESNTLILAPEKKPKPVPKAKKTDLTDKLKSASADIGETLTAEDTLSFLSHGLQKKVLTKMRQGYFGVDAELDLHGLTAQQAKQQLLRFLHYCVEDGCRCVHIIHGKGYRSENNQPVLKNQVNQWLRQHNDVQAFCSAAQKDGGAGAVLVLLHLAEKYADKDEL
jgi:DNA-nicking Smr family endonuclease